MKDKIPEFTLDYKVLPLVKLRDNPTNPNVMSPPQMEMLKKDILRERFKDPIIVRETGDGDYIILDGHHRKEALLELGADEGPCIVDKTDYGGKSEREQINLSGLMLNRIKGRLDPSKVGALLMGLRENYGPADISDITGYSSQDLENYASVLTIPELPDFGRFTNINFFHYPGGKSFIKKELLSIVPKDHKIFVEVFGGAGNLVINKPYLDGVVDVYNDIDGRLVNLFNVVRNQLKEFRERTVGLLHSHEQFDEFKAEPEVFEDPVENAVRFYYLLKNGFYGDPNGSFGFSRTREMARVFWTGIEDLDTIWARLQTISIEHLDFRDCIKRYDSPDTVFYLDPPYYGIDFYKLNFKEQDHEDLYKMLCGAVLGKWIMTYNNHPWVRDRYKGSEFFFATSPLNMGVKHDGDSRMPYHTLVLTNFKVEGVSKEVAEPIGQVVTN